MINIILAALALIFTSPHSVSAEEAHATDVPAPVAATTESQNSVKLEDAKGTRNSVSGDLDQEITNAKMRAESGSKSKRSLSMTIKYTGGSVQSPFGELRPRLAADPGSQAFTSLDWGLNGRYRWNKNDSVTGGTAFGFVTPLQGKVSKNDMINVNDPNVAYNHSAKVMGLQTSATTTYAYGTSINSADIDATHQLALSYNVMRATEGRLNYGSSITVFGSLFSSAAGHGGKLTHASTYGHDSRTQYSVGIFPQAEYAFNDHLSARTVFGYFNWKHLYGDTKDTRLLQTYVYQSIGIGWAVVRDVYLYPNVQFVPDNIRSDFTNVALNATINVF